MSLGLGDLNKKRKTPKTDQVKKTAAAWSRSHTARPWSSTGLHRATRNRPRLNQADAAISAEWMNLHAESLFSIDLPRATRLMKAQNKMLELEERIQDSVCTSLKALHSFCFGN